MINLEKKLDLSYSQKCLIEGVRLYDLDKFIKQNHAEYIECIEGCLVDNYMLSCKRGTAFIYEEYLNANSSGYTLYYISDKHARKYPELYSRLANNWDKLYNATYNEEEA